MHTFQFPELSFCSSIAFRYIVLLEECLPIRFISWIVTIHQNPVSYLLNCSRNYYSKSHCRVAPDRPVYRRCRLYVQKKILCEPNQKTFSFRDIALFGIPYTHVGRSFRQRARNEALQASISLRFF